MSSHSSLSLIILAAGKGTRMKSDKAKVLHHVFYAPMLHHVLRAVQPLPADKTIVVVGHQREAVEDSISGFDVAVCHQQQQLGTGHAVVCTEPLVGGGTDTVMILCGDTPLIQTATLQEMYAKHLAHGGPLTIMTTILENPANYGRVIVADNGQVLAIVEEKDATSEQKKIKEINAGIYCVQRDFLFTALKTVGSDNSQGEVYLTDIVAAATAGKKPVEKFIIPTSQDVLGVNSRVELAQAHKVLQMRRNQQLMLAGVTMYSPDTIAIAPDVVVHRDVVMLPGVHVTGHSVIGERCLLKNGVLVNDSQLESDVQVGAYSCLEGCSVHAGTRIAPHSVLSSDVDNPVCSK